jgi:hypothetical protein
MKKIFDPNEDEWGNTLFRCIPRCYTFKNNEEVLSSIKQMKSEMLKTAVEMGLEVQVVLNEEDAIKLENELKKRGWLKEFIPLGP